MHNGLPSRPDLLSGSASKARESCQPDIAVPAKQRTTGVPSFLSDDSVAKTVAFPWEQSQASTSAKMPASTSQSKVAFPWENKSKPAVARQVAHDDDDGLESIAV